MALFIELRAAAEAIIEHLASGAAPEPATAELLEAAVTVVSAAEVAHSETVRELRCEGAHLALLRHPDLSAAHLDGLVYRCGDVEVLAAYLAHPAVTDTLLVDALWFYRKKNGRLPAPLLAAENTRVAAAAVMLLAGSAVQLHPFVAAVNAASRAAQDIFITLAADAGNVDSATATAIVEAAIHLADG